MTDTLRSVHYSSADNPVPDVRLQHAEYRAVADQVIANGAVAVQTYDTTLVETAGLSQVLGVVTVVEPGIYHVSYEVVWQASAAGTIRQVWIEFAGTALFYGRNRHLPTAIDTAVTGAVTKFLEAGQTISIKVFQNSGGNVSLTSGERELTVTKVGAIAV